jgi:stringent starvation protein B
MSDDLTPSRPYLLRALNEWILDNNCTPYIVVDAGINGVEVPEEYVADGQIVLNVTPGAVRDLHITDEALSFSARFGGVPMQIYAPMVAIVAIYAKENGQGMVFGSEAGAPSPDDVPPPPPKPTRQKPKSVEGVGKTVVSKPTKRPSLKVIK